MSKIIDSTRYKVTCFGNSRQGVITGLPDHLIGRWVALVAADDGCNLVALSQPVNVKDEDWRTPTTYLQRFGDAMQALCQGKRPSNEILAAWCDTDSDDHRLQEFAVEYGFSWAQGIGLIDAAHVAARQPTEGVEHESCNLAAPVQPVVTQKELKHD